MSHIFLAPLHPRRHPNGKNTRKPGKQLCEKQKKPYPGCPIYPHPNGQWICKRNQKTIYFGPWNDFPGAMRRYYASLEAPDTLAAVIKRYLQAREQLKLSGEISDRHYRDTEKTLAGIVKTLGATAPLAALTSADWRKWRAKISETNGPLSLAGHITRVRTFLNWCRREKIIADLPADGLQKPSRKVLRVERAKRGSKMFSQIEIRSLLRATGDSPFHAMILLALNCGLGPEDLARLTTANIKGKWLDYPRPKTGIERRCPLWPGLFTSIVKG